MCGPRGPSKIHPVFFRTTLSRRYFIMSISLICETHSRLREEIRREKGEAAAKEFDCSVMGGAIKSHAGALSGALIGNAMLPVVGGVVGGLIGWIAGAVSGSKCKSGTDVLISAASSAVDVRNVLKP